MRNTLVGSVLVAFAIFSSGCSSCAGDDPQQQQQPQQGSPNTQLPKSSSPRRIHSPLGLTHPDGAGAPPVASAASDDAGQ